MKIGVLTSSRADYGIYSPLLRLLKDDDQFDLELIVFGMHIQEQHGMTINQVKDDDFARIKTVEGMPSSDSAQAIADGYGNLISNFSKFWSQNRYEWVIALGDRFEMSAAVQAGIPLEVKFAHLFGGETTLGAVDNIYRHQISVASKLHFVSTEAFKTRVEEITGETGNVHNVGSVSLDDLHDISLPHWDEVRYKFKIPPGPFVLVTFHPETVGASRNKIYSHEAYEALLEISEQYLVVITSTNADAMGSFYVESFDRLKKANPERIALVENFGRVNYFAAMKSCEFLLGNTSSGILEAAAFKKYVINVGDRQKGRLQNKNVFNVPFDSKAIVDQAFEMREMKEYLGDDIYYQPNTARRIVEKLRNA